MHEMRRLGMEASETFLVLIVGLFPIRFVEMGCQLFLVVLMPWKLARFLRAREARSKVV